MPRHFVTQLNPSILVPALWSGIAIEDAMNSQVWLLTVPAALSADPSIFMQSQVIAVPASAEVGRMCRREVVRPRGAHMPNVDAVFRRTVDNADKLPRRAPLVVGGLPWQRRTSRLSSLARGSSAAWTRRRA